MPFKCVDIRDMKTKINDGSLPLTDGAALESFVTKQLKAGMFMDQPFPKDTIEAARTQNQMQYSGKSDIILEYEDSKDQKGKLLGFEVNRNGQDFKIASPFEVTLDGSMPNAKKGVEAEVPKKSNPTSPSLVDRFKLWVKGEKIKAEPSNTSINAADDDSEEDDHTHRPTKSS